MAEHRRPDLTTSSLRLGGATIGVELGRENVPTARNRVTAVYKLYIYIHMRLINTILGRVTLAVALGVVQTASTA